MIAGERHTKATILKESHDFNCKVGTLDLVGRHLLSMAGEGSNWWVSLIIGIVAVECFPTVVGVVNAYTYRLRTFIDYCCQVKGTTVSKSLLLQVGVLETSESATFFLLQ